MQLMQRIGQTRNEEAQAAAALAGLEREAERLVSESDIARQELETLGIQRGQVALSFESVTERLKRLEAEISELRTADRSQPCRGVAIQTPWRPIARRGSNPQWPSQLSRSTY